MARYDFGGTLADFVVTSHRLGTLDTLALSAATLTMWSAQSGGTRYTDLVLNGSAVSSIVVGTDGQVPKFQGPDAVTEMWADGGAGRVRVVTLQGAPGPAGVTGPQGPTGAPSTVPGPTGATGPQGLPGTNAVPADNAVAGYIVGPGFTANAISAVTVGADQQFAPVFPPTASPCHVTLTNNIGGTLVPTPRGSAAGFTTTYAPNDLTRMTYLGSEPTVDGAATFPDNKNASFDYVIGQHSLADFLVETKHTGRYLEFQVKQFAEARFWIWIDGRPLTITPRDIGGTAGSTASILLDFGSTGGVRKVQFRAVGCRFYGATVDTGSRMVATTKVGPRIAIVGDSYGGGANHISSISTYCRLMAEHLGVSDVWNLSVGGTGYLQPGDYGTARQRIAQLTRLNPDIVLVTMGHNDSGSTNAAIQTEVNTYLTAVRSALPNAQIIVTSPISQGGDSTGYAAMQTAIFAGAAGISNLKTVDINTHKPFSGSGRIGAPAGNGNSDLFISDDGVHPTQDGHFYLAWWLVLKLRLVMLASRVGEVTPPALTSGIPFLDNFDRADSATTLGSFWTPLTGRVWGISTNKAYLVSGATQNYVTHDAETPDVEMTVTVGGSSAGGMGFCFRMTDNLNGYIALFNSAGHMKFTKIVGGTFTDIGDFVGNAVAGDSLDLIAKGSALTLKKNGTTVLSITDSTWLTASNHGLYAQSVQPATAQAWDNFTMVAAP